MIMLFQISLYSGDFPKFWNSWDTKTYCRKDVTHLASVLHNEWREEKEEPHEKHQHIAFSFGYRHFISLLTTEITGTLTKAIESVAIY